MDYPAIGCKELFYSYVIRYHHYSGNRMLASSFKEFYGHGRNAGSVLFPKKIAYSLKQINMEPEHYLKEHSVLPFYRLFLQKEDYEKICAEMFFGEKAYTRRFAKQQRQAATVKSDRLFYCPICIKEDMRPSRYFIR